MLGFIPFVIEKMVNRLTRHGRGKQYTKGAGGRERRQDYVSDNYISQRQPVGALESEPVDETSAEIETRFRHCVKL